MSRRVVIPLLMILTAAIACGARGLRSTRKALHPADDCSATVVAIAADTALVAVSGYDKTATALRESFFVTNRDSSGVLTEATLVFDYIDLAGRQIHQATHRVRCAVPPLQTRQLSVAAWDRQHTYYYYDSPAPRRQATPYRVACRVAQAVINRE